MKIDKLITPESYNETQKFFLGTWYNLCLSETLDSERVNYLNPLNGLNELLELYSLGDKYSAPTKRLHLVSELLSIFENDQNLTNPAFNETNLKITTLLLDIINDVSLDDAAKINKLDSNKNLIISLSKELIYKLETNYRTICTDEIIDFLLNHPTLLPGQDEKLYRLTNSLMSLLMTEGMPLAEFHSIYKNTLTNDIEEKDFKNRLKWFREAVTSQKRDYNIELKITSKKLYSLINNQPHDKITVNFSEIFPDKNENSTIIFRTKVNTLSAYAAKKKADHRAREIIDCYSYIIEKAHISLSQVFIIRSDEGTLTNKLTFRDIVSNDEDKFNFDIFTAYSEVIDRLLRDGNFQKLRLKLLSSFRQYQNGVSSLSMESKFVSFWSALEALTLGASEKKLTHDAHVLHVVIPNIGVNYIVKKLSMFKKALRAAGILNINDGNEERNIYELNNKELFYSLKNPIVIQNIMNALNDHIYLKFRLNKFITSISSCDLLYNSLVKHELKVRHHINRLYRVRNGIVHNALSYPVLDILCLNLEHYLRSCINSVFDMIEKNPTITTTSEAFLRFNYEKNVAMLKLNPLHGVEDIKKISELKRNIEDKKITPSDQHFADLLL